MKTKEKRTIKFYTSLQYEILKQQILSGKKTHELAREYAPVWNRTETALISTIAALRQKLGVKYTPMAKTIAKPAKITRVQVKEVNTTPVQEAKLTLPEGMTFEGVAKRVELHSNHFRVYF